MSNLKNIKIYLKFGDGEKIQIAEPTGFDASKFKLEPEKGRLGADAFFVENPYTFDPSTEINGLTHQFDRIINEYNVRGYEAKISFIVSEFDVDFVVGEFGMEKADTDEFTYFTVNIIQDTKQATLKRRQKINVDLYSNKDLDDNTISYLEPEKMLIKAIPTFQKSEWKMDEAYTNTFLSNNLYYFSITPVIEKSQILDTLSPYKKVTLHSSPDREYFNLIEAVDSMTNVKLNISNFTYDFRNTGVTIETWIAGRIGLTFDTATPFEFEIASHNTGFQQEYQLPNINKGEKLWFYIAVNNTGTNDVNVDSLDVQITSIQKSISSVTNAIRLIDAIKQVVKSTSGMNVIAPRFENGGEFYDQYITNGHSLRLLENEPFNLTLDDVLDWFPEIYGDYQIEGNENVFVGIYRDFHIDEKIGSFTMPPNEKFKSNFNPLYSINEFGLKYTDYEKTNDEDLSRQGAHTEVEMMLPNLGVKNEKKKSIGFIRCPFLLDKTRKDAFTVTEETATKQDEKIFIIDTIHEQLQFTEYMAVNHVITSGDTLNLINDNSFRWDLMGMTANDFIALTGDKNPGTWRVVGLTQNILSLIATGTTPSPTETGTEVISITYSVTQTTLTNRTVQGFNHVYGASYPEGFSNLKFTLKRNILNYYSEYLDACCKYSQDGKIKNTKYVHNRNLDTFISGNPTFNVIEGMNIPVNWLRDHLKLALVTPKMIETIVECDFTTFWNLQRNRRKKRGYIEIADHKGSIKNIFPNNTLEFDLEKSLLYVRGAEKA